jgi:hypothetical protein
MAQATEASPLRGLPLPGSCWVFGNQPFLAPNAGRPKVANWRQSLKCRENVRNCGQKSVWRPVTWNIRLCDRQVSVGCVKL